jgi:multiple sugar transport system ATP-binding protein
LANFELRDVRKSFGDVDVIRSVSMAANDGEFVVLVGPSGCGKSTLLRMIAGLEPVSGGQILIAGEDVTEKSASDRGLAMVFQSYALYPHMTVFQNMSFGLENIGTQKAEIVQRVNEAARLLQIEPYLSRRPKALSGGQRQRVAIGRAIVRDPRIFLFDEPLSNLDAELRVSMRKELAGLHAKIGGTMVYVTHDQIEAMTLADRIVVLRDGLVEQVGTPLELYFTPSNKFVAGFIGSPAINILPVAARDGRLQLPGGGMIDIPVGAGDGISEIGVRPEHITIVGNGEGQLSMCVVLVEELGGETYIYGKTDTIDEIRIKCPGLKQIVRGDDVGLSFDLSRTVFFSGEQALPRMDGDLPQNANTE